MFKDNQRMFPVNSIIDKTITSIKSSIEEQLYSALHIQESPTNRYGKILDDDLDKIFQTDIIRQATRYLIAKNAIPITDDKWIIHFTYLVKPQNKSTDFTLIDNYANTYSVNIDCYNKITFGKSDCSEDCTKLNNDLIDLIKALPHQSIDLMSIATHARKVAASTVLKVKLH